MDRLLVLDLTARARSAALPPDGERRIVESAPAGWRVEVVRAETNSEGDGSEQPSEEAVAAIANAEAYYGYGIPRGLFERASGLRWVHSAAAGVGATLYPELVASDVQLTNASGVHAVPMAEYVVAGVLHFLRGLDYAVAQQARAIWDREAFVRLDSTLREMDSVRALIVGTGAIGSEVAVRLSALGAICTGVRRHVELGPPPGFKTVVAPDRLTEMLPEHDVIVLAAPHTAETENLLTAERLDLLSRATIVVNVARGAMIDENALADRIADGRIRGAVLDVFREEPLVSSSRLWQLPQVLITPHISSMSPGRYWPRQIDLFLDNWRRYDRGEPLRNLIDKTAGY